MARKFKVEKENRYTSHITRVIDDKTDYVLMLREMTQPNSRIPKQEDQFRGVFFSILYPTRAITSISATGRILVTGRDLDQYPAELKPINPHMQHLEIGPGMGGLIPALAAAQEGTGIRPIAIDPVNYSQMIEMLEYARRLRISNALKKRAELLAERCHNITDPSKVTLFNTTAAEALAMHPELKGLAHIVVDNFASSYYHNTSVMPGDQYSIGQEILLKRARETVRQFGRFSANSVYGSCSLRGYPTLEA